MNNQINILLYQNMDVGELDVKYYMKKAEWLISPSSKKKIDHKTAIKRIQQQAAIVTSSEAVLFELLEKVDTAEFKKICQIIK